MKNMLLVLLLGLSWPVASLSMDAAELEALRQAAAQGDAAAQFEMGILYEYGFSLPDNRPPALAWYTLAAEQGHARAAQRRDLIKGRMTSEEIDRARKLVRELVVAKPKTSQPPPAAPPVAPDTELMPPPSQPLTPPPQELLGPPS